MSDRLFNKLAELNSAQINDEGGVAAEYGVIIAGVAVVVAVAAATLGGKIGTLFDSISF
ncbi:MAG: Flp family type IVb pilin [Acidimicrobiales bacterium]|jgi:Flp pilus assembly pilin Flp